MHRIGFVAALSIVAGLGYGLGASTGAQTPPPINPVGTYTVSTANEQGSPLSGRMTVRATNGNYSGEFVSADGETVPMRQVTTSASHMMAVLETGNGVAVTWLERQDDGTFTGTWHPLMPGINVKVTKSR